MQRTHARGIRTGAVALAAGMVFALAMQPMHGGAQDEPLPEPFVSGLWEHKLEITINWEAQLPVTADAVKKNRQSLQMLAEWNRGGLPTVRQAADDLAIWGCGFYKRDAVGPIYQSQTDVLIIVLTYACAIR